LFRPHGTAKLHCRSFSCCTAPARMRTAT
jgi:hypothetical protein